MKLRVPHYYKDFHCIASECKDNCCIGGWEIDIDDETAEYYLQLQGEFGDRLRQSIGHTDEYCFKLKDGKCPFLDQHNLCQIYQELGEDKMGVVCTQFPRYSEYYGNSKETGVGLACEEAERIIFEDRMPFTLTESEIEEAPVDDPEYDENLAKVLFQVRDYLFDVMNEDKILFYDKLILMIYLGREIQDLMNHEEEDDSVYDTILSYINKKPEELIQDAYQYAIEENSDQCTLSDVDIDLQQSVDQILAAYQNLEVLNDDWPDAIDHVVTILHGEDNAISEQDYNRLMNEYATYMKARDYEYRNLLNYFIYRYFMKAVYDHDVYAKVLMSVTNFLVIRDMDLTKWIDNQKKFSFQDRIDTVHIFSREVEYSEDNLEELKEEFIFDDIFDADVMLQFLIKTKEILN